MTFLRAMLLPFRTGAEVSHIKPAQEASFQKDQRPLTPEDEQKRRVSEALWRAFPEARSESHLAALAAPHFKRPNGRALAPRTVRYWLRGDSLPDYMNARTLTEMVGTEHFYPKGRGQ